MTASAYIQLLKQRPITKTLVDALVGLEISLRTEPMQWLSGFVRLGGSAVLRSLMLALSDDLQSSKPSDGSNFDQSEAISHCLKALKALLNNPVGVQNAQNSSLCISAAVDLLENGAAKVRSASLDFLAGMCSRSADWHSAVMEQLMANGFASKLLRIFQLIGSEAEHYQVTGLQTRRSLQ
jgi:hypothetical protein